MLVCHLYIFLVECLLKHFEYFLNLGDCLFFTVKFEEFFI